MVDPALVCRIDAGLLLGHCSDVLTGEDDAGEVFTTGVLLAPPRAGVSLFAPLPPTPVATVAGVVIVVAVALPERTGLAGDEEETGIRLGNAVGVALAGLDPYNS